VNETEAVGHHADDRRGNAGAHRYPAAQHVPAGTVTAFPDVAADDGHGFGAGAVVSRRKVAAEDGPDAEHVERVGRYIQAVELFGNGTVSSQADGAYSKGGRPPVEHP